MNHHHHTTQIKKSLSQLNINLNPINTQHHHINNQQIQKPIPYHFQNLLTTLNHINNKLFPPHILQTIFQHLQNDHKNHTFIIHHQQTKKTTKNRKKHNTLLRHHYYFPPSSNSTNLKNTITNQIPSPKTITTSNSTL